MAPCVSWTCVLPLLEAVQIHRDEEVSAGGHHGLFQPGAARRPGDAPVDVHVGAEERRPVLGVALALPPLSP